jgi:hypothetical protein
MPAAVAVCYKVYKGSKSHFAYILMLFTFIDGAQYFGWFFIIFYPEPIIVEGRTVAYREKYYPYIII